MVILKESRVSLGGRLDLGLNLDWGIKSIRNKVKNKSKVLRFYKNKFKSYDGKLQYFLNWGFIERKGFVSGG